jgi:hypothetical protein
MCKIFITIYFIYYYVNTSLILSEINLLNHIWPIMGRFIQFKTKI